MQHQVGQVSTPVQAATRAAVTLWAIAVFSGLCLFGCAPPPVAVRTADEAELARTLRQHRGEVVLVDFWATWCPGCLDLFPHTVELHKRFASRGLAVISVSFDDPEDDQASVLDFLTSQGAHFENFISRHGAGPKSAEAFEIENGTLPHFKLYDRKGVLRKTFGEEPFEVEEIDRAVEELLAE